MNQLITHQNQTERHTDLPIQMLEQIFPGIRKIQLQATVLTSPLLKKLINLLKFSIPVHTYSQELLQLYDKINRPYYNFLLQIKETDAKESHTNIQQNQRLSQPSQATENIEIPADSIVEKKPLRSRINYLQLSRFIDSFTPEMEIHVNPETIRQAHSFNSWDMKVLTVQQVSRQTRNKNKNEVYEVKFDRQKMKSPQAKTDCVNITLGKNISLQAQIMKKYLIERAKNNKLLDKQILTEMERVQVQVNFILNRLTEEYFAEFIQDLRPFATHQLYSYILVEKIIEKIMEEHNFISLYARLVKNLKNIHKSSQSFKEVFVVRLQQRFYKLIRSGEWSDRQELYKKQLIGMCTFIGELINCKFMSKFIFPDCFYELINSFIVQYYKNQNNKQFYYYEIYVQCIIKMMQKMGAKYDSLITTKSNISLSQIVKILLDLDKGQEYKFEYICDYLEVLKQINNRLPSQRFKITFLLQDFRCTKVIKNNSFQPNNQADIVKNILGMDHSQPQNVANIPNMIERCDRLLLMKDFYYQFAQGNSKQVNKNIDTFKMMLVCANICEAAVESLKINIQGLYMIECDFPFLGEGIAKVLKLICDEKRLIWSDLKLQHSDEDVNGFIQSIQSKYFKLMVQD